MRDRCNYAAFELLIPGCGQGEGLLVVEVLDVLEWICEALPKRGRQSGAFMDGQIECSGDDFVQAHGEV